MNFQRIILGLFAVLVVTSGVLWFLNHYELEESTEYVGFRGEARTNTLMAARLFLKRMGIPAQRVDSLVQLPDTHTVLVVDTGRYTLSRQRLQSLLDWVEAGGHLITRARTPESPQGLYADTEESTADAEPKQDDPLLETLGIRLGGHVLPDQDDLPLQAQLPVMDHALEVDPEFFHALIPDPQQTVHALQYNDSTWLLEQDWGNGKITLVSNLDFIENPALHSHDHAEFFWYMLHALHEQPTAVWLLHQDDTPPLWQQLWQSAWPLLLTLAVFIPLAFLALIPRFGPLLPEPPPERRRILEHIQASGVLMWKLHQQGDPQYRDFAATVEQLYRTRKTHGQQQPDA